MCAQISYFWIIMLGLIIYNVFTLIPEWGHNNGNNLYLVHHCKSCMHYFLPKLAYKITANTQKESCSRCWIVSRHFMLWCDLTLFIPHRFNFGWICEIWNSNIISRKFFSNKFKIKKWKVIWKLFLKTLK